MCVILIADIQNNMKNALNLIEILLSAFKTVYYLSNKLAKALQISKIKKLILTLPNTRSFSFLWSYLAVLIILLQYNTKYFCCVSHEVYFSVF